MVRTRASILNTPLPPLPLSSRPRILEAEDIGDSDNCYHEVRTYVCIKTLRYTESRREIGVSPS